MTPWWCYCSCLFLVGKYGHTKVTDGLWHWIYLVEIWHVQWNLSLVSVQKMDVLWHCGEAHPSFVKWNSEGRTPCSIWWMNMHVVVVVVVVLVVVVVVVLVVKFHIFFKEQDWRNVWSRVSLHCPSLALMRGQFANLVAIYIEVNNVLRKVFVCSFLGKSSANFWVHINIPADFLYQVSMIKVSSSLLHPKTSETLVDLHTPQLQSFHISFGQVHT